MNNNQEDFSKIYDEYIEKIYRFIFIKVNSQEITEDLTSETFLRCWECFNRNKKIDNIQSFLYKIARNLVTDYYRQKGKAQIVSVDNVPIIDEETNLEEKIQDNSDINTVKSALLNLRDEYQNIVVWHYLDDLSVGEIANMTGKSEGAVRVCLHRALKGLKNELKVEKV
jgi:RNA polymerase sigma-70 factor, ECF subfamily